MFNTTPGMCLTTSICGSSIIIPSVYAILNINRKNSQEPITINIKDPEESKT